MSGCKVSSQALSLQGRGMWVWMNHFSVPAVAFFYTRDSYGEGLFSTVTDLATAVSEVYRVKAVPTAYQTGVYDLQVGRDACQRIRDTGSKVVLMAMTNTEANSAMYIMEQEGMLGTYQLVASESIGYMESNTYKPTGGLPVGFLRFLPVTQGELFSRFADLWMNMTPEDLYGSEAEGRYMLNHLQVSLNDATVPKVTEATFADPYNIDVFNSMLFDAGYAAVNAINNLLNEGHEPTAIYGQLLLEEIQKVNFEGVSGQVTFNSQGDRSAPYELWNAQPSTPRSDLVKVGLYDSSTGVISMSSDPYWTGGQQSSQPPSTLFDCPFGFIADTTTLVCEPCKPGVGCGYRPSDGFPLGIFGPITSVTQEFLAAAVAFDIDFRKNFDPAVRARFGPPVVNISNLDPRLRIKVQIGTSNSQPNVGMNTALDWFLGNGDFSQVAVILGGYHSAVTAPISSNAAVFQVPQVGWGATSPALSDKVLHPYFVRTSPPDSLQGHKEGVCVCVCVCVCARVRLMVRFLSW